MESYWQEITPATAKDYLSRNAAGRSINQNAVSMYARDMAAGHWRSTHQGIAFDTEGNLIDGQHRMAAVVKSRSTVKMWVTVNVERESFGVFDIGRQRTMADRFSIEGIADGRHATQLAAIARRVTVWNSGKIWSRKYHPTRDEIAETFKTYPELADAARFAHSWSGRRTLSPALAGFCHWLFGAISRDDAAYFMEKLRTGENLESGDPILALRERLMDDRTSSNKRVSYAVGAQRQEIPLALTVLAWNHYRKRNRLSKLQLPSSLNDESFPRPA